MLNSSLLQLQFWLASTMFYGILTVAQAQCIDFPNHIPVLAVDSVRSPTVIKTGPCTYEMWFDGPIGGGSTGIHHAHSVDGLSWTNDGPVLYPSATGWNSVHLYNCAVIKQGEAYKMWYTGYDGFTNQVGYATSTDGISWTKHGDGPVVSNGTWDNRVVRVGSVCFDAKQGTYTMWYTGGIDWYHPLQVGLATSTDGINWTKQPSPVFAYGDTTEWVNNQATVVESNGQLEMYFASSAGDIRMATSPDGLSWTLSACQVSRRANPCGWDSTQVSGVSVLVEQGIRRLWYAGSSGSNFAVGYSLSAPRRLDGDVDENGVVDIDDLLRVINEWGDTCGD